MALRFRFGVAFNVVTFRFPEDVPEKYKDYMRIGRRARTSVVLDDKEDANSVIIITPDKYKMIYLTTPKPNGIGIGVPLESNPFVAGGMPNDKNFNKMLYIVRAEKLKDIEDDETDGMICIKDLWARVCADLSIDGDGEYNNQTVAERLDYYKDAYEYEYGIYGEQIGILINFLSNTQPLMCLDLHEKNIMKDGKGSIIFLDPFVPDYYVTQGGEYQVIINK